MTALLITILLAILIVAVLFYAIGLIPGIDAGMANILRLAVLIVAVVVVVQRTGAF
jgi:hypothetical protein